MNEVVDEMVDVEYKRASIVGEQREKKTEWKDRGR